AGAARDRRLERGARPAGCARAPAAPARGAGRGPAGGDDGPAPPRAGRGEDHLRHLRDARSQRRRRTALVDARRLPARPLAAGGRADLLPRGHRRHGRRRDHLSARLPRHHPLCRGGRARRRVAGRARHRRVGRDGRSPRVLAARAAVRAEPRPGGARAALRRLAAARERRPGDAVVTLAEQLGREVVAIRDGSLPPDVVARALDLLRDHLGVALGGAGEESSVVLRRGLAALGLRGGATVLGTAERLPAPHAALANGAAAHALEMDDTHQGGSLHLGATVFPAALAAAELGGAGGERVLRAAVAGYEVAARLAMALGPAAHYRRGFHLTATCGAFGAAAAAGVVLGLHAAAIAA